MIHMIGLNVKEPAEACSDKNCPFHGQLAVHGRVFDAEVVSDKMRKSVVVKREYMRYVGKYERYEKRTSQFTAHNPSCINAKAGDKVKVAECRPLSKTKNFVVIEVM
ncbi:MAG: 30S ribosomal protein S17 [Candidatus Methanofastidiosa archaeon]|nr:30S ribosomal protein S17 [Candidatus Methanofastidiosa archaeon]MDD4280620.1 30S ribosomal protein S17 [Candidatus Methanofastidiosa archaeon]